MRRLADPAAARAFLLRDPALGAWPLCFLGPRDWPYIQLWTGDSGPDAAGPDPAGPEAAGPDPAGPDPPGVALWVFDHPWWGGSVQAFGGPPALAPLVRSARLPGRAFARMLPAARALLTARYRFDWLAPIVRMAVTPEALRLPPETDRVEPLGQADGPALTALYACWPESRFRVGRLRQGYRYVGIREGGRLVAAAEHVLAAPDGSVAVVQGVLVDPSRRGHGLGRTVTAALTRRLFDAGARLVVLDVRESNLSALAAYDGIGYRRHVTLLAGPGTTR